MGDPLVTRSVYVVGGAGVGKSTFVARLTDGLAFGPLEVIHDALMGETRRPNPMHGHRLPGDGLYLGVNRASFPGSDGLSRTCGTSGAAWLRTAVLPRYIVSEGKTLATRAFQAALHERTELLLVHLTAAPELLEARRAQRGSEQSASWANGTVTQAARLADYARGIGARVLPVDAGDPEAWDLALDLSRSWVFTTRPLPARVKP